MSQWPLAYNYHQYDECDDEEDERHEQDGITFDVDGQRDRGSIRPWHDLRLACVVGSVPCVSLS